MLIQDESNSDLQAPLNSIVAWKHKNSHHKSLVREKRLEAAKKKEKEEYDKKHCLILGLADLTSKNSARDFMERAKEKSKQKRNLNSNLAAIADADIDIKQDLKKYKNEFNREVEIVNRKLRKYDKQKEDNFLEAYKQKELADAMARDVSIERFDSAGGGGDSLSNGGFRSTTGSRLTGSFKRRRATTTIG